MAFTPNDDRAFSKSVWDLSSDLAPIPLWRSNYPFQRTTLGGEVLIRRCRPSYHGRVSDYPGAAGVVGQTNYFDEESSLSFHMGHTATAVNGGLPTDVGLIMASVLGQRRADLVRPLS